ncbi:MAG: DinB family protein, partial [Candidatus Bathyarchaeota archaeon]
MSKYEARASEKIEMMKAFARMGFQRLDMTFADTWSLDPSDHDPNLTEEQLDWKSCPEANTIRWNLTHMINGWSVYVTRVI